MKLVRIIAGEYELGQWRIFKLDPAERSPGMEWMASSSEMGAGEYTFRTLREATAFARTH